MTSDAIAFTYRTCKTMADGTLRVTVDIEPRDAVEAFTLFSEPGISGAMVRLHEKAAQDHQSGKGPHGQFWRALVKAGAFLAPDVLEQLGSDEDYCEWVRRQPSAASGDFDYDPDTGDGRCECAHVRRVANGSGTATKPPYSAIPLTHSEHVLQHQGGESALGGKGWFDKMRARYVTEWAMQRVRETFAVDSLSWVEPERALQWFEERDLLRYVPEGYRRAA